MMSLELPFKNQHQLGNCKMNKIQKKKNTTKKKKKKRKKRGKEERNSLYTYLKVYFATSIHTVWLFNIML